jgi:hypothetical protein
MQEPLNTQRSLGLSYLGLRKCIGIIGIALPIVLIFGRIILERRLGILDSMSAYYYSVLRDVFVGSLCAVGVFLFSYRYERWSWDNILGDIAGVSAIGVAYFPTPPAVGATEQQVIIGRLHLVFVACFFITLAIFALWLFRRTDRNMMPTRHKLQRNKIYLLCGITILLCLALMFLDLFLPGTPWLQSLDPGFWLETLAMYASGIAWFVKGEGFPPMNDKIMGV